MNPRFPTSVRCRITCALLAVILSACSGRSHAALKVEGTAEYEAFANVGAGRVQVQERFVATIEENRWLLSTELLSIQPQVKQPQLFCPPRQTVGSDGRDIYYLKDMSFSNGTLLGWVEPGPSPNIAQSPSACLLWLAYCSGDYLARAKRQELNQPWVMREADKNRRGECVVPVFAEREAIGSNYLSRITFWADGRVDPCNPSRALTNVWAPPWSQGYTQAVYRVERRGGFPVGEGVPTAFVFEFLTPDHRSEAPRLRVMARIHATVTNAFTVATPGSWLPRIPARTKVDVQDYRVNKGVLNWGSQDK